MIVRFLESVLGQILEERGPDGTIRWLDIGSGDGKKIADTSRALCDSISRQGARLEVDLLDRTEGLSSVDDISGIATFRRYTATWPDFAPEVRYDLVSIIHSAYQFGQSLEELEAARKCLRYDGRVLVIHESSKSDFHRIKREVYPDAGMTHIDQERLMEALGACALEREFSCRLVQRCKVPAGFCEESSPAFPWFLLETAESSCEEVAPEILSSFKRALRGVSEQRTELAVDDFAIVSRDQT